MLINFLRHKVAFFCKGYWTLPLCVCVFLNRRHPCLCRTLSIRVKENAHSVQVNPSLPYWLVCLTHIHTDPCIGQHTSVMSLHPSFLPLLGGELFAGTSVDFMGANAAVFRTMLGHGTNHQHYIRTEAYNHNWLNGEDEVSLLSIILILSSFIVHPSTHSLSFYHQSICHHSIIDDPSFLSSIVITHAAKHLVPSINHQLSFMNHHQSSFIHQSFLINQWIDHHFIFITIIFPHFHLLISIFTYYVCVSMCLCVCWSLLLRARVRVLLLRPWFFQLWWRQGLLLLPGVGSSGGRCRAMGQEIIRPCGPGLQGDWQEVQIKAGLNWYHYK